MQRFANPGHAAAWLRERVTARLSTDSRKVGAGDGFIAWPGSGADGRRYVSEVLAMGATACLVEEEGVAQYGFSDTRIASYAGLKAASGPIASAYFGDPGAALQIVAITGTNGKTSTAWWLAQAMSVLGRRCGMVGTLGIGTPVELEFNGLTTPDPVLLQEQLRRFVDRGFTACAIEASSIGIAEHRLDATAIQIAIFTNFTQDHLDYHGSMDSYWQAKRSLFDWPGLNTAVVNIDDEKGAELATELLARAQEVWTVSATTAARLRAENLEPTALGMAFEVVEGNARYPVSLGVAGHYNVLNVLGVIAALRALGVSLKQAVNACNALQPVPGRLEVASMDGCPMVVVDFAHTPDALEKALVALRPVAQRRGGRLWCVFGCGGNRDTLKRPLMAAMAQKYADQIVITSDNPRGESASAIISQILQGTTHSDAVYVESDRALAIKTAVSLAQATDVILLAGKGHEAFQEIQGVKTPFSDRRHADAALSLRASAGAGS